MKCTNNDCDNVLTGRQRAFCSDKCRMACKRADITHEDSSGRPKSNKANISMPESEQSVRVAAKSNKPPEVIDGKYNPEYLPGGQYYTGCCYQDDDGNWEVKKRRYFAKQQGPTMAIDKPLPL